MHTIVFLDIEASGLHPTSMPVEIGLARLDLSSLQIASWSAVIASPHLSDPEWDPRAIEITGIGPALVAAVGRPAAAVVEE